MYEYLGLQDVFFIMLYGMAGFFALLACLYLLFRRGNAFVGEEVKSSLRIRRWTAALMAAMAASHVWWYVIGVYWLADDWVVRTITVIMLDHATLVPLVMGVLLALLQDRRRPLWPWLVVQAPVVADGIVGIVQRDMFCGFELPHYWQLGVAVAFVVYYIFALRQYGRWLLDNYADLERKEVWQSLLLLAFILFVHMAYSINEGSLFMEYLAQVNTIVIITFLLWRVETLQELGREEDEINK